MSRSASTPIENFPDGLDHCKLALQAKIFEASHTYRVKGTDQYLTIIETLTYTLTGNKIFITSGHGKYHLVLAKTSSEESLASLSMFLVSLELERDGRRAGFRGPHGPANWRLTRRP